MVFMPCIFCEIAKGNLKESGFIYENENFFSMPDRSPVTKGHSLVIPKKHFTTFLDLKSTLGQELIECIKKTTIEVMKETGSEGFNLISNNFESAGQAVNHVHFHIIPRKKGDDLKGKLIFG